MREEETMDIIVNGARGRMGQEVCRLLQEDGHRLAAAVDRPDSAPCGSCCGAALRGALPRTPAEAEGRAAGVSAPAVSAAAAGSGGGVSGEGWREPRPATRRQVR